MNFFSCKSLWIHIIHFIFTLPVIASNEKLVDKLLLCPNHFENCIKLDIADTDLKRSTGLMYRNELPDLEGIIFIYDSPSLVKMWMRNTRIPLDMIFIREKRIMKIVNSAMPCMKDPCFKYDSNGFVDSVIELNAGTAKSLNLKVGQIIDLVRLDSRY